MSPNQKGLGVATLKTRLDLSGLNQGLDEAKVNTGKFASAAAVDLSKAEKSVNDLGKAKGFDDIKQRMNDIKIRSTNASKGIVTNTKEIGVGFDGANEKVKKFGRESRDELGKTERKTKGFANAARAAILTIVTAEASKRIIGFLNDSAEKAEDASESFGAYAVTTDALTASQNQLQIALGQRVTPALGTINTVFKTTLDLLSGGIQLTDTIATNTETMGSNFTTAGNDAIPLNQQLANISARAADISLKLVGLGQISFGLIDVLTAPFKAFGDFLAGTKQQITDTVESFNKAFENIRSGNFGAALSDLRGLATTSDTSNLGLVQGTIRNAQSGLDSINSGFAKIFSSDELKQNLANTILDGLNESAERIQSSQYASNLKDSTKSGVKKGVVTALESQEVADAVSRVFAPLASAVRANEAFDNHQPATTSLRRLTFGQVGAGRNAINLTPATPNIRIPSSSPVLPVPSVPVFNEPFQELTPFGFPSNVTSSLRGQPRVLPTDIAAPSIGRAPLPLGLDLTRNVLPDTDLTNPVPVEITNFAQGATSITPQPDDADQALAEYIRDSLGIGVTGGGFSPLNATPRSVVPNFSFSGPSSVGIPVPDISARSSGFTGVRFSGQDAINNISARAALQNSLMAEPEATKERLKAEQDAAEIQRKAAEDAAQSIIQAGSQFGNAVLSFSGGNIGGGVSSLAGGVGSIASIFNPLIGQGIAAGGGLLGGFIDLFTSQDKQAEERKNAARNRSVPAVTIVTNFRQENNNTYYGASDPRVQTNNQNAAEQVLNILETNIVPRLERLELTTA